MSAFREFHERHKHAQRPQSLREAMALMAIENNPFTPVEIEMIESFHQRGLSPEERKAEVDASIERDFGLRTPK